MCVRLIENAALPLIHHRAPEGHVPVQFSIPEAGLLHAPTSGKYLNSGSVCGFGSVQSPRFKSCCHRIGAERRATARTIWMSRLNFCFTSLLLFKSKCLEILAHEELIMFLNSGAGHLLGGKPASFSCFGRFRDTVENCFRTLVRYRQARPQSIYRPYGSGDWISDVADGRPDDLCLALQYELI